MQSRRQRRFRSRSLASLFFGLLVAAVVQPPTARADEDGIQVGDGRLHLYLDTQGRYDTFAVFDIHGNPVPDFLFDVRPALRLDIPSPIISLDLAGDADYVIYLNYPSLNRLLADGSLGVGINRGGVVGLDLSEQFDRSDNNNMVAVPFLVISDFNDAGAKVGIRPGGGALAIEPSYDFIFEHFEPVTQSGVGTCPNGPALCDPTKSYLMDFYQSKISLNLRWRFLPKTALLLGGDFLITNYLNPGSGATANAPLDIVDGTVGLAGLLTSRVELVAKVGYAQTLLQLDPGSLQAVPGLAQVGDNHNVIGQLQLGYIFGETGFIKAGVVRMLNPAPTVLSYYVDTRPYVNFHMLLAGRLTLHLDMFYDVFQYALDAEGSAAGRTDGSFRVDVGPEYEITRWLRAAVGYDFTNLQSTDTAAFNYPSSSVFGGVGYSNHEVYLRVTLAY